MITRFRPGTMKKKGLNQDLQDYGITMIPQSSMNKGFLRLSLQKNHLAPYPTNGFRVNVGVRPVFCVHPVFSDSHLEMELQAH